jgi:hypothetical protein
MTGVSIRSRLLAVATTVAVAASGVSADPVASMRRPRGIYAVVAEDESRGADAAELDALTSNPAVSGLAIRVTWSTLQPAKDHYDFSRLDAAFASASSKHKTVQLILIPGFETPRWVLDELTSCDSFLPTSAGAVDSKRGGGQRGGRRGGGQATTNQTAPVSPEAAKCGKATFQISEGRRNGQKRELPLPWNAVYKGYWKAFLREVATRFGPREAFVSIAVAGPTAESAEMILPRAGDQLAVWGRLFEIFYRDSSYHRSDKAIVEEWEAAINLYGETFRDITLVSTRGSGLLDFTHGQSAAAQEAILAYFAHHRIDNNLKATQTSGMKACRETKEGIVGVKQLSADRSISPRILGGAQFDTSFSQKPAVEGCAASCDSEAPACRGVTPAEALSNVLSVYFDGTPLSYLQIYAQDIRFANANAPVQAILEQASKRILQQSQ